MISMQRVICRAGSSFFLFFLLAFCACVQTEAMRVGRWVNDGVDSLVLAKYLDSPKIRVNAGDGKNTVIVEDSVSQEMVVIASGMFPFSTVPNLEIKELIDYIYPDHSLNAKNLNVVLSNLSRIQAHKGTGSSDSVKRWAQSVLDVVSEVPSVLDGTGINFYQSNGLQEKLNLMVGDGKKKGLSVYLKAIKGRLLTYHVEYIDRLKGYFNSLEEHSLVERETAELSQIARTNLDKVKVIMGNTPVARFSEAVAAFQSVARFKENAHRLVHSENILLYCVTLNKITFRDEGIRFFTKYDMCESCEDIVWRYAHRCGEAPFVVLSEKEYLDSRNINDEAEYILLKKKV